MALKAGIHLLPTQCRDIYHHIVLQYIKHNILEVAFKANTRIRSTQGSFQIKKLYIVIVAIYLASLQVSLFVLVILRHFTTRHRALQRVRVLDIHQATSR